MSTRPFDVSPVVPGSHGALAATLKNSRVLHFSHTDVGFASNAYLAGAAFGAILFGWLTDRLGRRKLFFITRLSHLGHKSESDP